MKQVIGRSLEREESHVYQVLRSERFLKMEGLSKEVPFFIYHYDPSWTWHVADMRERIKNKLRTNDGLRINEVNLYDLAIELLKKRGVWERLLTMEPNIEKPEFHEMLQDMLDPHTHLAPAIGNLLRDAEVDIVFLTGIGEVFPFIRTHTVLENLQSVVVGIPMLTWFPGTYEYTQSDGHQLRALNLAAKDSYYRAKDILEQDA